MPIPPVDLTNEQFQDVLNSFGLMAFSTLDFCRRLEQRHHEKWAELVARYGAGGAGAGQYYTAYVRMGQILDVRFRRNDIHKLDFRPAPEGWGSPIIRYWTLDRERDGGTYYPDELVDPDRFLEGAKRTVTVNQYERNREARTACIEHHGLRCKACGIDFEERYGPHGTGFIHVHHLKPLSEVDEEYEVNPKTDLVPVCPNCHAMIHRSAKPLSITELKAMLSAASTP